MPHQQMQGNSHPHSAPSSYRRSMRENWTTGVFYDELATLDALVNNRLPKKIYATETETQAQFKNPKLKSITHLKHIEENLKGRYAYTPTRVAPRGTVPSCSAYAYPEVIPRFHLPKMPY